MNENLNLVDLLKDVPIGARFHHSVFGTVYLKSLIINNKSYPIRVYSKMFGEDRVTSKGFMYKRVKGADCILFPSKTQRDWGKWYEKRAKAKLKTK